MDAKEGVERLKTTYLDRLKRLGSLNLGSTSIGEVEGYLAGQKDNKRGLRPQDVLRSQEALGNPLPEEVYHEALFSEEKNPAAILAYSREYQELRPDPFITALLPRLRLLAEAGATPSPDDAWESLQPAIRDLDRQRRRNRQAARKKLQQLIAATLDRLEQAERPRQGIGDLCTALGVLAAIYRLAGRRDDAVDLLVASRPLVIAAGSFKTEAEWYQKAAYLLVDLKRNERAKGFLRRALLNHDVVDSAHDRNRILVDYAYVLNHELRHAEALQLLQSVLPRLAGEDLEYCLSAHQLLSAAFEGLGDSSKAWLHLNAAIQIAGDDLLAKASCLARRADLQARTGGLEAAMASYREALPLYAKCTGVGELAQVAMEYAVLLLDTGNQQQLREMLADLSGWITTLKGNLKLRTAIEDFQALMQLAEVDVRTFQELRLRISTAATGPHSRDGRQT